MEVLEKSLAFLKDQKSSPIIEVLSELSRVISETGRDAVVREQLASDGDVWQVLNHCIVLLIEQDLHDESSLRAVRGLVLLSRNLVIACGQRNIARSYYETVIRAVKFNIGYDEFGKNLNVALLQFLVNATSSVEPVKVEDGFDVKEIRYEYEYDIWKACLSRISLQNLDDESKLVLLTLLNNLFNSSEFLYKFLNDKGSVEVLIVLLGALESDGSDESLDQQELLVLSLFQKVYLHESFVKFWVHIQSPDQQLQILNNAQMILTNKENFDEFELTSLLSWVYKLFEEFSATFIKTMDTKVTDRTLYLQNFKILDIISNLGRFDHARQFLNHYKCLPQITALLRVLESKFERARLREANSNVSNLPGLKTLTIEIITFLVYGNLENQEHIRESGTLEVILNNCQLDSNEPFIKERAIVCLKYVLENNQANQDFVRKLQPEKIEINDEGKLEQMGIELDIGKDGKIKVHNKNTDKIKELK